MFERAQRMFRLDVKLPSPRFLKRRLRCEESMAPSLRSWFAPLMLALAMSVSGCAGAPVQEMSNARQAIKAARDAGADKVVPSTLSEAQALLERAETNLQRRAYRDARRDAIAARSKASEALDAAQLSGRDGTS